MGEKAGPKGGAMVARRHVEPTARPTRPFPAPKDTGLQTDSGRQGSANCRSRPRSGDAATRIPGKSAGTPTVRSRGCADLRCRSCSRWARKRLRKYSPTTITCSRRRVRNSSPAASSSAGLMFLDFEEHHFHRRIMQEAFTRERLNGYLHPMDTICRAAAAGLSRRTNWWFTRTSNARCSTSQPSCSWATSLDRKAPDEQGLHRLLCAPLRP